MEMERRVGVLPYFLGGLVVVACLGAAVYIAYIQSLHVLREHTSQVARDVLARADDAAEQIDFAFAALTRQRDSQPCSAANIALMRKLAVQAQTLRVVGYLRDDRLICSSFGHHGAGIVLGPASYLSRLGREIRTNVVLPFADEEVRYLVTTDAASGYSAILLPGQVVDQMHAAPDVELGIFGRSSKNVLLHRGQNPHLPEWLRQLADPTGVTVFHDHGMLVALRHSTRYDLGAFAALPLTQMYEEWRRFSWMLVPLALVAGGSLATVIVLLARWRLSLRYLLQQALRRDELYLVYQPIVDLQSGRWVGAEALIRWRRPDGSQIPPDLFIPLAERSALIGALTAKVMDIFAHDMAGFLRRHPGFHVSLNFSSHDLSQPAGVERLIAVADAAGISPGSVTVEVTERALVQPDQVQQNIRRLHAQGIRVAIDDFGTGYCGLSYLTELDLDILKIDKVFVDSIGTDAATKNVVAHIIEIGKSLGLEMIAEGVETQAQADYLRSHGVQYAQGWLFARPMDPAQLLRDFEKEAMPVTGAGVQRAAA